MVFLEIAWWKILIGFFIMHYTAGLILSVVFIFFGKMNDTIPFIKKQTL